MRKLRQIKVWCSDITCCKCGRKNTLYHGVETDRSRALRDIPTYDPNISYSGVVNGWFVGLKGKEMCPICWAFRK